MRITNKLTSPMHSAILAKLSNSRRAAGLTSPNSEREHSPGVTASELKLDDRPIQSIVTDHANPPLCSNLLTLVFEGASPTVRELYHVNIP
jgi:hypothetical protein